MTLALNSPHKYQRMLVFAKQRQPRSSCVPPPISHPQRQESHEESPSYSSYQNVYFHSFLRTVSPIGCLVTLDSILQRLLTIVVDTLLSRIPFLALFWALFWVAHYFERFTLLSVPSLEHFFEWPTHLSPLLSKATHLSPFLSKPTRLSTFLSTQKSRFALESTFLSVFALLSTFLSAQKSTQAPAQPTSFLSQNVGAISC